MAQVPMAVRWIDPQGQMREEQTRTETLSGHGALIRLKNAVELGMEIELLNLDNYESAKAQVVWASEHSTEKGQRVGIEFLTPKAAFWGKDYPF
jgi:hypothetical protein